jgi:hypothetical protein
MIKINKIYWKKSFFKFILFYEIYIKIEVKLVIMLRTLTLSWIKLYTIVFRPGPVQGPGSSVDRVTGSPRSILFFNPNDVILVKKKQKSTGRNRIFDRVTSGFSFPYFYFNPARFQPRVGQVPGRPVGLGFKTMLYTSLCTFKCLWPIIFPWLIMILVT